MKYNSEVQYTVKQKNKGETFSVFLCQSSVRFSGLPRIKGFPVYHSLASCLGTRTPYTQRILGAGNTIFIGSSAAVDTSKLFPLKFRALQTPLRSLTTYYSCCPFAILGGLASLRWSFSFILRPDPPSLHASPLSRQYKNSSKFNLRLYC